MASNFYSAGRSVAAGIGDPVITMTASRLSDHFPRYTEFAPRVPVHCITEEHPGTIHRYYDSSPFSPSGRYVALTRLPFEDRLPTPAETAQVIVVDLETGEVKTVAETRGWDMQLGAQVQWGADDRSLLFNDVDVESWTPFGVRMNPVSGEQVRLGGTVYAVSPDGRWSASPCLMRTAVTQRGYGVVVPRDRIPANRGASSSDGIFVTDMSTGTSRLLISIDRILDEATPPFARDEYIKGDFYGFHVKWNPQGTRLMFVLRWLPRTWLPWKKKKRYRRLNVITMDADGGNARVAISDEQWRKGGNHPNWCPDGDHILMNLNAGGDGLRFVKVRYDGTGRQTLAPTVPGSGHPTMHPDGIHILTDAYPHETVAYGDGTTPLRWIDSVTSAETALLRIRTRPTHERKTGALRVDPHPAWDGNFRRFAFNACPDGRRRVYVADLTEWLDADVAPR